eukprot:CAMPEP_0184495618 /NCGR_PEP_ID=MMETSP0113_2-20130426/31856_1 /TAXON_ID=91329 /ORGANISM="Norrisiella sphaerica, Strain BC52" /LENGTH=111 /DNA_ID=CAMNT_0026881877 /DNA_START=109 /DNA_END=444 /DNA_ORIENTATION=+
MARQRLFNLKGIESVQTRSSRYIAKKLGSSRDGMYSPRSSRPQRLQGTTSARTVPAENWKSFRSAREGGMSSRWAELPRGGGGGHHVSIGSSAVIKEFTVAPRVPGKPGKR